MRIGHYPEDPKEPEPGEIKYHPFVFSLIKENVYHENFKIENVIFNITIRGENGEYFQCIRMCNKNGNIYIPNIDFYGKITIDIQEIESAIKQFERSFSSKDLEGFDEQFSKDSTIKGYTYQIK